MSGALNKSDCYSSIPVNIISSNNDGRAGTKRKRLNSTARQKRQEDIPWTAARCNRLLRTITSRIQILRRLSENNFADKVTPKKSPARRKTGLLVEDHEVSTEAIDQLGLRLAALETPSKTNDPEWLPEDIRKPISKTYSGRGKVQKIKLKEPAESREVCAGFRSPFIKRILRFEDIDSPIANVHEASEPWTPRRSKQKRIILQPNTHAERALRTLLDSFETLLITTAPERPPSRKAASSLCDMCLRRVPAYIEFEQKWAEDEDEDYDFDAIEAIYVDLENCGSNGWSGLREVVRWHAVKLVSDCIDDRTWPLESLPRLLDICKTNQATREGQALLRAWFCCTRGRIVKRLAGFVQCALDQGWYGYLFRTLRETLESGRLRSFELSQCQRIWQDLLKALSRRSSRVEAASFLECYASMSVLEGSWPESDPNQFEYLHSVMVLITALCTTNDNMIELENGSHSLASQVHRLAISVWRAPGTIDILKISETHSKDRNPRQILRTILTSSFMLRAMDVKSTSRSDNDDSSHLELLETFVAEVLESQPSNDRAGFAKKPAEEFVSDVARCIAHVDSKAAQDVVRDVVIGLLQLSKRTSASALLKNFAVGIATNWAEYKGDNDGYVLAEDVERAASSSSSLEASIPTPVSSHKVNRFRWEEGLCEWIKATPLSDTKRDMTTTRILLEDQQGCRIGRELQDSPSKANSHQATDESKGEASDSNQSRCRGLHFKAETGCIARSDAHSTEAEDSKVVTGPLSELSSTTIGGMKVDLPRRPKNTDAASTISTVEQFEEERTSTESEQTKIVYEVYGALTANYAKYDPPYTPKQASQATVEVLSAALVAAHNAIGERDELSMSPEVARRSMLSRPAKDRGKTLPLATRKREAAPTRSGLRPRLPRRAHTTRSASGNAETSEDELGH